MEWVERAPMNGQTLVLPRTDAQPVFVDPHGHRVRRLRHAARVIAVAAAVYLALLALGVAGPAASPFSLLPGGAKAGESGPEAVHAGSGPASASAARDAALVADHGGGVGPSGSVPGAPTVDPGAPFAGSTPAAAPGPANAPSAQAPAGSPQGGATPSGHAPSSPPAGNGGGNGNGDGNGTAPKTTPSQGNGPPAGHVPPGQANKPAGTPGNGNGNGNGPPDNHGQQMAAQHSHSPNH